MKVKPCHEVFAVVAVMALATTVAAQRPQLNHERTAPVVSIDGGNSFQVVEVMQPQCAVPNGSKMESPECLCGSHGSCTCRYRILQKPLGKCVVQTEIAGPFGLSRPSLWRDGGVAGVRDLAFEHSAGVIESEINAGDPYTACGVVVRCR